MDNIENASQEAELKNCADDFVYFCENYVKINHPKKGLIPLKLHDYQKRYVEFITNNQFVIGKKFRNGGFSTINMAWLTWRLLFKLDENNMVICHSDREAIECCKLIQGILRHLPEWMLPEIDKLNDHYVKVSSGSTISFGVFKAACGKFINYLIIEESAFIKDMEENWKALFPCISHGGNCIAMSTVNGNHGWFYDGYTRAKNNQNSFSVFDCAYTEHPDYNNEEWVANTRKNLGERGWKQEVLCEFLEPEDFYLATPLPKGYESKYDNWIIVKSVKEEQETLRNMRKKAAESGVTDQFGNLGNIKDNDSPIKLVGDDKDQPVIGLSFDHIIRPRSIKGYYWADVAEEIAEEHIFLNDDHSLAQCIETKKANLKELEDRVNEIVDDKLLRLAGVIEEDDSEELYCREDYIEKEQVNTDQQVLAQIIEQGNFPESLKVSFSNKKLCINGTPTNINEFDVCCLYSGLSAFTSHDKAIVKIAKIICKKMTPLFGVKEDR